MPSVYQIPWWEAVGEAGPHLSGRHREVTYVSNPLDLLGYRERNPRLLTHDRKIFVFPGRGTIRRGLSVVYCNATTTLRIHIRDLIFHDIFFR